MKRLLALCGALVLTMATTAPALADDKVVVVDEDYFYEYSAGWLDCSFPVMFVEDGHWTITEWRDEDGLPVRGKVKSKGTNYYYAVANPDNTLSGKYNIMGHVPEIKVITPTLYEWYDKMTGNFYNIHVPGSGNVDHWAGNYQVTKRGFVIIELHKLVGHYTLDSEAICAALDPAGTKGKKGK